MLFYVSHRKYTANIRNRKTPMDETGEVTYMASCYFPFRSGQGHVVN